MTVLYAHVRGRRELVPTAPSMDEPPAGRIASPLPACGARRRPTRIRLAMLGKLLIAAAWRSSALPGSFLHLAQSGLVLLANVLL
jgi:hypothetical protein